MILLEIYFAIGVKFTYNQMYPLSSVSFDKNKLKSPQSGDFDHLMSLFPVPSVSPASSTLDPRLHSSTSHLFCFNFVVYKNCYDIEEYLND